ncbi:MAG: M48 family metallopeptidase [Eubacteriales bacterium]
MREYSLIRSARRTLSLEITPEGSVLVRAPQGLSRREIDAFVLAHEDWIVRHAALSERRRAFDAQHFSSPQQLEQLAQQARRILPEKTAAWARVMGVVPSGVRITHAKTRFGSCSAQNRISYSCRLMAYPEEAIDYVVVHELSHIRYKNHSPAFYAFIARFLPDYRRREALLKLKD